MDLCILGEPEHFGQMLEGYAEFGVAHLQSFLSGYNLVLCHPGESGDFGHDFRKIDGWIDFGKLTHIAIGAGV